jgi:hypothetical protein
MAQWRSDTQTYDQAISRRYEVMMLANNANGDIVSTANPLPVTLGSSNVNIIGNITIPTVVGVNSTPGNPVHTHITEVGTSGNLQVSYLPIGGNVNVTSGFITLSDRSGNLFSFNNHAINTNRGWTMDDTMRPVVSIRVSDTATSITDLAEIIEYEIGNNNASQSTIIYEWYEGEIAISGAAIPAWTSLGTKCQYRVYQDKNSSNQSNTFTPNGAIMRHSGVIIGKNSSADEGPATLNGGATPNMLTLCMRRVDNATKLDVWFAFTIKELT